VILAPDPGLERRARSEAGADHGDHARWPADLAALVAGRAGLNAVGARHARLATVTWLDRLLSQAGRPHLVLWAGSAGEAVAIVSALTVGLVLAGRRPRHPVGWLLLAALGELHAAGVAAVDLDGQDVTAARWSALPAAPDPTAEGG
jgi:hypothetical protein